MRTETQKGVHPFTATQQGIFEGLLSSKLNGLNGGKAMSFKNVVLLNSAENDCRRIPNTENIYDCTTSLTLNVETQLTDERGKSVQLRVSAINSSEWTKRLKGINPPVPVSQFRKVADNISSTIAKKMKTAINQRNAAIQRKKEKRAKALKEFQQNNALP
ncbi:hypothetical protein [Desulfovibrio gilichinskyi]|nr:hypothetical protein [Desulfovibrio gilichinskyi]